MGSGNTKYRDITTQSKSFAHKRKIWFLPIYLRTKNNSEYKSAPGIRGKYKKTQWK